MLNSFYVVVSVSEGRLTVPHPLGIRLVDDELLTLASAEKVVESVLDPVCFATVGPGTAIGLEVIPSQAPAEVAVRLVFSALLDRVAHRSAFNVPGVAAVEKFLDLVDGGVHPRQTFRSLVEGLVDVVALRHDVSLVELI